MSTILMISVVALVILFMLVTSVSSFAQRAPSSPPDALRLQEITPTPMESDASVPGSTDGIMWMGIVIALIVLVPMLASRAVWAPQS